jgi:hypothetical protein
LARGLGSGFFATTGALEATTEADGADGGGATDPEAEAKGATALSTDSTGGACGVDFSAVGRAEMPGALETP